MNIERSGSKTSSPSARICSLSFAEPAVEITRSSPSEIALTPSLNASAVETSRISKPLPRSHAASPPEADSTQTAASFGARIETSTSMWTNWPGIGSIRTSQPLPPSSRRAGARPPISVRSSPLPISITPGSTIITSPPSIAPAVIIRQIGISPSS